METAARQRVEQRDRAGGLMEEPLLCSPAILDLQSDRTPQIYYLLSIGQARLIHSPDQRNRDMVHCDCSIVEPTDVKTIWAEDDVPEGSEYEDIWDTRQQPEYEVLFKQRVGTEDVFLGMSRKDGSTACCEDMVIRINLPGCKSADLTLDVKERFLGLRSSVYKLGLHLPHPVDSKNGKAEFDADTHTLQVTLTMKRDFDFINLA